MSYTWDMHRLSRHAWGFVVVSLFATMFFALPARPTFAQVATDLRKEIGSIGVDVKKKKAELEKLATKAEQIRQVIKEKKDESTALEDQIALFDNRIARTQLDISIAKDEIRSTDLEIRELDESIKAKEARMERDRALLGSLARRLYHASFRKDPIDILFARRTFSEYFDAVQQVAELQQGVKKALSKVAEARREIADERAQQEVKKIAFEQHKRDLDVAVRELEDEKALKEAVLLETKSSELEFRYLLAELREEQNDADSEIAYLEKTLREKMNLADRLGNDSNAVLSWPLVPARGLSTRFHDPEYPFRNVYEHPGVDIRAYQGTAVRAAAAGVVARAKDAGMGYSYVMVIHNNNVSTVYGHLTRITAREDSFVERGEIVGYSGGMPGTAGAGRMTTGPHLHFETRVGGIPVDPLRYLVAL